MNAAARIRDYYDALRAGDPLHPFFREDETTVKFGVGEELSGYEAVAAGLRDQTATTTGWEVESRDLRVGSEGPAAWFADDVYMGWNDTEAGIRYEFDTRWSGSLLREDDEWLFTGMHVSTEVNR
ncbi:nuclear transport factor 2 family protein [Halosegnis marinus]|uniref:Nuclear transport factor 2 family protein n=1 Tax=Halosegnis marinus TaxID=3034023 RepID=A0ABD5ZSW6_9EURY|nr:nuclear transport factor 2 family protein [Halosegnis sp. DT85]